MKLWRCKMGNIEKIGVLKKDYLIAGEFIYKKKDNENRKKEDVLILRPIKVSTNANDEIDISYKCYFEDIEELINDGERLFLVSSFYYSTKDSKKIICDETDWRW